MGVINGALFASLSSSAETNTISKKKSAAPTIEEIIIQVYPYLMNQAQRKIILYSGSTIGFISTPKKVRFWMTSPLKNVSLWITTYWVRAKDN